MNKRLTLGFSPCPNDCFIFDALVHEKIDSEGLDFDFIIQDVEELNRRAFEKSIDITKLSFHAFAYLTNAFQVLDSGAALGFGVGPLLITQSQVPPHSTVGTKSQVPSPKLQVSNLKSQISSLKSHISTLSIAIPGKYTTANFLLSLAFPQAKNKVEMLFSDIEEALLSGAVDAGVIIHENRFTYEQKGLMKILDLGAWWEEKMNVPIPLGGIAVKRTLSQEIKSTINRLVRKSVEYAFANPLSSLPFIKQHAQEMNEEVVKKHINLYVNKYSVDLGEEGRRAVNVLLSKAEEMGVVPDVGNSIFI